MIYDFFPNNFFKKISLKHFNNVKHKNLIVKNNYMLLDNDIGFKLSLDYLPTSGVYKIS